MENIVPLIVLIALCSLPIVHFYLKHKYTKIVKQNGLEYYCEKEIFKVSDNEQIESMKVYFGKCKNTYEADAVYELLIKKVS